MAKTGKNGGQKSATQLKKERNKRIRNIAIIVVAVVLALSMTVPSVAMILGGSGDGTEGEEGQTSATMLQTSQAYADTFTDLKSAQETAEDPTSYDATFQETYRNWTAALMQYSESTGADPAEIDEAYQLLVDDIIATQSSSATPDDYLKVLAYAYYGKAYSLVVAQRDTSTDLSAQLSAAYAKAISYGKAALSYSFDESTACNLATVYFWQNDMENAIATATSVTETSPNYVPAWFALGNFYKQAGDTDAARAALEQALEVDPQDTFGYASSVNALLEELG